MHLFGYFKVAPTILDSYGLFQTIWNCKETVLSRGIVCKDNFFMVRKSKVELRIIRK